MKTTTKVAFAIVAIVIIIAGVFGYIYLSQPTETVTLNGSGATFPYPLLSTMISQYQSEKTNVQINYQAIGQRRRNFSTRRKDR